MSRNDELQALMKKMDDLPEVEIPSDLSTLRIEQMSRIIHELWVHQIELEMQNDELRETQHALTLAQEKEQDTLQQFQRLYHNAPIGYISMDSAGIIHQCNEVFAKMGGYAREKMERTPIFNYIHPEDQDMLRLRQRAFTNNPVGKVIELRMQRSDGSSYFASLEGRHENEASPDEMQMLFVVIRDITQRKLMEKTITDAKHRAEKANRAKSEFLSRMSHELRTPLNAILGFGQLLEMDSAQFTQSQQDGISHILSAGEHLLQLINEVLDISRIEAGGFEANLVELDAQKICRDVAKLVAPLAQKGQITIEQQYDEPELFLFSDTQRLTQVLVNLISNAIKYNNAGGRVLIHTSLEHDRDSEWVRISVEDNGFGIPADFNDKVFEPFQRAHKSETQIEGTGIGLSLCKNLVEAMGGRIDFKSVENQGSVFWVDLPYIEKIQESLIPSPAEEGEKPMNTQERLRLLYVEDNHANMKLVEMALSKKPQFHLSKAYNAEDGLEMIKQEETDLVLMDIDLPGMSGLEAVKLLKADPVTAKIPVIAVSANAMTSQVQQGQEAGFDDYVTKPINIKHLIEVMEHHAANLRHDN